MESKSKSLNDKLYIDPKSFYFALKGFGDLISPQVNAFSEDDIYRKPISFSFRFEQPIQHIYEKLANAVVGFKGGVTWIMHNEGSTLNFTIEPEVFFNARKRSYKFSLGNSIKDMFDSEYFKEMIDKALLDIPRLCQVISELSHSSIG